MFNGFTKFIKGLEKEKIDYLTDKNEIIKKLGNLLIKNIEKIDKKYGIAFSGGVDSGLLALLSKKLKKNFKLYSVGIRNSKDLDNAVSFAMKLKYPLRFRIIGLDEAEIIIKKVIDIIDSIDVTKVGVGCVTYSVMELAKEDNIKVMLTGLGSEEIFCGYDIHKKAFSKGLNSLQKECFNRLKGLYERDLSRDEAIARHFNMGLICPYLEEDLIKFAMKIHPKFKIKGDIVKLILRETAVQLGLKKEFAFRKKIASQYGSGFDKVIGKLAKRNGFKLKRDYLESLR